ncbi:MAG: Hint domain-containing protein [Pseudomonadota bacterium]
MGVPSISEIKYLGAGTLDFLEVRVPDDYPDPENLVMVIYDRNHNGSTTQSPAASDIYNVTADGLEYTEDTDGDGNDDDGVLHYTFGTTENGTTIFLHKQDAVGLYNSVTGETYGLYSWGQPYTVSTASGDPFAGQPTEELDDTGVTVGSSLVRQPGGDYVVDTTPDSGESYVCFTVGTGILTDRGRRPVEGLSVGDLVITKDRGLQPIRWIGQRRLGHVPFHFQPITIRAHSYGRGCPDRDIDLSPNHCVLNAGWANMLHFGRSEVLASAKSLTNHDGCFRAGTGPVTYVHFLLDTHALVDADGLWSESLYLGDESLGMMGDASRAEVFALFPELRANLGGYGPKVRQLLTQREAALLS